MQTVAVRYESHKLRTRYMATSLCISVVGCGWLLYEVSMRVVKPPLLDERVRVEELTQSEPKVGSKIDLKTLPTAPHVALLWIGACPGCALHSVSEADLLASAPSEFRLVIYAEEPKRLRFSSSRITVIAASPSDKRTLHAFFSPRTYRIEDGILTAIQRFGSPPLRLFSEGK